MARMAQAAIAGCTAMGQRAAHGSAASADRQRRALEQQAHSQRARQTQYDSGLTR